MRASPSAEIIGELEQVVGRGSVNPGCHLQVERGLREDGAAIEVVHPIALLAGAYRRESSAVGLREVVPR